MNNFNGIEPHSFFDENTRVRELIDLRRGVQDQLQIADEIKRRLCTKIQGLMTHTLRERIVAIAEVDPELSAYIVALESLNEAISKRNVATVAAPAPIPLEVTKLQALLVSAKDTIKMLQSEQKGTNDRIEILAIKLQSYEQQLALLGTENAQVIQPLQPSPDSSPEPMKKYEIRLEDLPPMPTYDINFDLEESVGADSLLE
jgi:hypothetical protein